jgi:hypothetical protein
MTGYAECLRQQTYWPRARAFILGGCQDQSQAERSAISISSPCNNTVDDRGLLIGQGFLDPWRQAPVLLREVSRYRRMVLRCANAQ